MSEKTRYDKRDYYALQEGWRICRDRYLNSNDPEERFKIINDFKDNLVNVSEDGLKALRKKYDEWEETEWEPFCKKKLAVSIDMEHETENNIRIEWDEILQKYNYMRFREILQIIQDSGIGLGDKKERYHGELRGFVE